MKKRLEELEKAANVASGIRKAEGGKIMTIVRLPPSGFRLIVMGTGPFAVPTFQALLALAAPSFGASDAARSAGQHRRDKAPVNPMRRGRRSGTGLEVFEPESINSPEAHAWLQRQAADLFVVCDYGQILSHETLGLARLGGINLHASLLPKYRGAAPINWAIYHGETETGVTVIHMTPQLDAGPASCNGARRLPRRNHTAVGIAAVADWRGGGDGSGRIAGQRFTR